MAPNYRLDAAGGSHLTGLAAAIGGAGAGAGIDLVGAPARPLGPDRVRRLRPPLLRLSALHRRLLAGQGADDRRAAGDADRGPPPADRDRRPVEVRPRSGDLAAPLLRRWAVLAVAFIGGAAYSSFIVLRDGPVGPPGHGSELQSFLPILHGKPVLYAGQDRYAAYDLLGADTHVPLVEFPDPTISPNPEKPFDTGDAYSPIDFDSFTQGTLDRFPYVITGRAAWNSQAPPSFRRIADDPFVHPLGTDRQGAEGPPGAARGDRRRRRSPAATRRRSGSCSPTQGRAALFPARGHRAKTAGAAATSCRPARAPRRRSSSGRTLAPVAAVLLPLRADPVGAPGFSGPLEPALDGQRPNTISLANDGQFWPAGEIDSDGGPIIFTIAAADPSTLQKLTGYDGKANVGNLVAVRAGKSGPFRSIRPATAGSTGTSRPRSPSATALGGGLGGHPLGRDADDVPDPPRPSRGRR